MLLKIIISNITGNIVFYSVRCASQISTWTRHDTSIQATLEIWKHWCEYTPFVLIDKESFHIPNNDISSYKIFTQWTQLIRLLFTVYTSIFWKSFKNLIKITKLVKCLINKRNRYCNVCCNAQLAQSCWNNIKYVPRINETISTSFRFAVVWQTAVCPYHSWLSD